MSSRVWELMAVDIDAGPSSKQTIAASERCGKGSRVDRMRMGYLPIYTGYFEGKSTHPLHGLVLQG